MALGGLSFCFSNWLGLAHITLTTHSVTVTLGTGALQYRSSQLQRQRHRADNSFAVRSHFPTEIPRMQTNNGSAGKSFPSESRFISSQNRLFGLSFHYRWYGKSTEWIQIVLDMVSTNIGCIHYTVTVYGKFSHLFDLIILFDRQFSPILGQELCKKCSRQPWMQREGLLYM